MRSIAAPLIAAAAALLALAASAAGDDRLDALNVRAEALLAAGRAKEAAALYENASPPSEEKALKGFLYSAAIAATAAGDEKTARRRLVELVERDAFFGSAVEMLARSVGDAPLSDVAVLLPRASRALAAGGFGALAEEFLRPALLAGECRPDVSRPVAQALLAYLAEQGLVEEDVGVRWTTPMRAAPCEPLRRLAGLIDELHAHDSARIEAAAAQLLKDDTADVQTLTKLLRKLIARDVAARRYAAAYARALATVAIEPSASDAALEAAYVVSVDRTVGDPAEVQRRIKPEALPKEQRAVFFAQLGEAFEERSRFGDAAGAYAVAAANSDGEAAPYLRLKLAQMSVRTGNDATAVTAFRESIAQFRETDPRAAHRARATAIRSGVFSRAEAPELPSLPELEVAQSTFDAVSNALDLLGRDQRFARPADVWSADASYAGRRASASTTATPAVDGDHLTANLNDPITENLGVRAAVDHFTGERSIAGIRGNVKDTHTSATIVHAEGAWTGTVAFTGSQSDEEAFGASAGRVEEATWRHAARRRSLNAAAGMKIHERGAVEMSGGHTERSYEREPHSAGETFAVVDRDGIRRGTWGHRNHDAQVKALRVLGTFFLTETIALRAGTESMRTHWTRSADLAGDNTEVIFNTLRRTTWHPVRLYRTADLSSRTRTSAFWTGAAYRGNVLDLQASVRMYYQRASSSSEPADAHRFAPELLPALPSDRGRSVAWAAVAPAVAVAFERGRYRFMITARRDAETIPDAVIAFANRASLTAVDALFFDFDGDGRFDTNEECTFAPQAMYGAEALNLQPPRRDSVGFTLSRRLLRGELILSGSFLRQTGTPETRPLIADQNGTVRPSVRADYVPARLGRGIHTLAPQFIYTGGYVLENSRRRREIAEAEVRWTMRSLRWSMSVDARLANDVWRLGERYEREHDPTPLAQTYDRWGFLRGNLNGAPASAVLAGDYDTSLVLPNSRWSASITALRELGIVRAGATVAAREGYAVSPFIRVVPEDGLERFAATSRAERLPSFAGIDVFLEHDLAWATLRLECLRCAGDPVAVRRFNQQNAVRANEVEETTEGRAVAFTVRLRPPLRSGDRS